MPARGTAINRQLAAGRGLASNRGTASGRLNVDGSGGGGGGSDVSNVSSLPAPGVADPATLYHLSKDDLLYILNSNVNAMIPVHIPGWARRDGVDDDEWEGSNIDPPAGWTWDNQDSTTPNTNSRRKSFLVLEKSNNANAQSLIYKNVPASPNKTYYACLQWASDISHNANCQIGIAARNNSTGKLLVFIVQAHPFIRLHVARWTTSTSFDSVPYDGTIEPIFPPGDFGVLGMTFDGTSLSFKYSPFYNGAFENFVTVYSEAVATFLGGFNSFGITILKNSATTNALYCDWIRVI